MQLTIEKLNSHQKLRHPIYFCGHRVDFCFDYNAQLISGINFLFGDFFGNGWLVAYTICKGKNTTPWHIEGNFYIDDNLISYSQLRKISYYVGWDDYRLLKNIPLKRVLKLFKKEKTDEIIKQLEIQDFLLERPFSQMGHRMLKCSCMIGILKGKKILCYPWLEKGEIDIQMAHFKTLSEYAKKNNLIVVIPTDDISEFNKEVIRKVFRYNSICDGLNY